MAFTGYPFTEFDEATKRKVFNKGRPIDGYDSNIWRRDICGYAMRYDLYGQEEKYGWEIDHIYPRSLGGETTLDNLQPLWWENNRRKGDKFPWHCA